MEISLTKGKTSIIDEEDYERVIQHKWCASDSGNGIFYGYRKNNGKTVLLHRFIMNVSDKSIEVDHKNNNPLDNRKSNLRTCSRLNNNRNKSPHKNSTSKYLGVSWDKIRSKWKSNIYVNKKLVYLGRFESEIDAAIAYDEIAKKEFKEYANLNFK